MRHTDQINVKQLNKLLVRKPPFPRRKAAVLLQNLLATKRGIRWFQFIIAFIVKRTAARLQRWSFRTQAMRTPVRCLP